MRDDSNIRPYSNKELMLFPPSIGDYLPQDHLAHVVDEAVESIDLKRYYEKIAEVGNPSYDPEMMIKVWFYGYATGVVSSRKIEEMLRKDVAFIYLSGMQQPDFKTIAEFRRKNLEELKDSFVDIVQVCHRLGMVKLGEIAIDSKAMKANAAARRSLDEKGLAREQEKIEEAIGKYLAEAETKDKEEDERYGKDKREDELPEDVRDKRTRVEKMRRIAKELAEAKEKLKKSGKKKINVTDKDAQFQKDNNRLIAGYRAQAAVDSQNQVIVANDVTNEQCDVTSLLPMTDEVRRIAKRLRKGDDERIKILADSRYNSEEKLAELEERKDVDAYMPDMDMEAKKRGKKLREGSPFHMRNFEFKEQENCFICPARKTLRFVIRKRYRKRMVSIYKAKQEHCRNCAHFGVCTIDEKGRSIRMSEYEPLRIKMREKLKTPEGKKTYAKRRWTIEPVFGNLSYNLGYREFRLRGSPKVGGEFNLMCIGHNLQKIAKRLRKAGVGLKRALAKPQLVAVADTS